jgi:hypothetical protein
VDNMTEPGNRSSSTIGDGQTCDRCTAFAPFTIGDYADDAFSAVTTWFACSRHLAKVLRESHWTLDAVEVRYVTAEEAEQML